MLRIIGWTLGVLVVLAAGAFAFVAVNLNGWVEDAIETYGPDYTGTAVTVDSVSLSPFTGAGEVRGLTVANPEGYEGDYAMRVGRMALTIQLASVFSDPVVIEVLDIDGAEVHAVSRNLRDTNLQEILRNIEAATPPPADADAAPGPQVIVDRLDFRNARASATAAPLGSVSVRVPDVELTGVGRETAGASIGQVLRQLLEPVVAALITSMTDGRVRDLLEERGEEVRGRVEEEAERLRERLRDRVPF